MAKRIGICGGGNISQSHFRAAQQIKDLEIAAVYGRNREKVTAMAAECGASPHSDLSSFLDTNGLDLVALGSPSGLHASQGIEAARRGIHVLTEKPIDISTERADALIRECEENHVQLGVFFQDRVAPDIRRLKRLIDEGQLGKPILLTAHVKWYRPPEYYSESKWRGTWALDGGGAVINQAIHTLDLLLWLLGKVSRVYAKTKTLLHSIEAEDTAVSVFEFENGALGTFEAATSAFPGHPRRVYISGTRGTVTLEHDLITSLDLKDSSSEPSAEETSERNLSESSPVVADITGHRLILEDFLHSIESGRPPICSGPEGRLSVELVEAIYESSRSGKPVHIGI